MISGSALVSGSLCSLSGVSYPDSNGDKWKKKGSESPLSGSTGQPQKLTVTEFESLGVIWLIAIINLIATMKFYKESVACHN